MQLQRDKSNNGSGSGGMKSMEELIGLINIVIDIKGIIASFEHCVIIMEYWKDEVKDCKIYQDFLKKFFWIYRILIIVIVVIILPGSINFLDH